MDLKKKTKSQEAKGALREGRKSEVLRRMDKRRLVVRF